MMQEKVCSCKVRPEQRDVRVWVTVFKGKLGYGLVCELRCKRRYAAAKCDLGRVMLGYGLEGILEYGLRYGLVREL